MEEVGDEGLEGVPVEVIERVVTGNGDDEITEIDA